MTVVIQEHLTPSRLSHCDLVIMMRLLTAPSLGIAAVSINNSEKCLGRIWNTGCIESRIKFSLSVSVQLSATETQGFFVSWPALELIR